MKAFRTFASFLLLNLCALLLPTGSALAISNQGDTVTQPPTLVSPVTDQKFPLFTLSVTYTLPEDAQPGSAQFVFTDESTAAEYVLTLHNRFSVAGTHTVAFASSGPTISSGVSVPNPDGGSEFLFAITSGPGFDTGVYSVVVRYRDALGNPQATSAAALHVLVDNHAPIITYTGDYELHVNATSPDGAIVNYPAPTALDDHDGAVTPTATQASGTLFPPGLTVVTFRATDTAGNYDERTAYIVVDAPLLTVQLDGARTDGQTAEPADFGLVPAGGNSRKTLMITNSGIGRLRVTGINLPAGYRIQFPYVSGGPSGFPLDIHQNQTRFLDVLFEPTSGGVSAGTLNILSNGYGAQSEFTFSITGRGENNAPVLTVDGKGFGKIADFDGAANGSNGIGSLVDGGDGWFYGVTESGGANFAGTAFKVNAAGVFTKIADFSNAIGSYPSGGLFKASDGAFYGLTTSGGAAGYGSVYKLTAAGALTTFASIPSYEVGYYPVGTLVQDADGNFYCAAKNAGGPGTILKITPAGVLSVLFTFNYAESYSPNGSLVIGNDGNLYGTTSYGGNSGAGTLFKITPAGSHTTLHHFTYSGGYAPAGGLIKDSAGNLYGTTSSGGTFDGGILFQYSTTGTFSTVAEFSNDTGKSPTGGLLKASDGNFYLNTDVGGPNGSGTVVSVSVTGTVTVLGSYANTIGVGTSGPPIEGADGNFYGLTRYQGANGAGTVTVLDLVAAVSGNDATPATIGGTFSDLEGNETVTLTASFGTVSQDNGAGTWSWTSAGATGPFNGVVTITATDSELATATGTFDLTLAPSEIEHGGNGAGVYVGNLTRDGSVVGQVRFTMTSTGIATGYFYTESGRRSFRVKVGTSGVGTGTLHPYFGSVPYTLTRLTDGYTFSVSGATGTALRSVTTPAQRSPHVGTYNLVLQVPNNSESIIPTTAQPSGFATLRILSSGLVNLVGRMPNGAPHSSGGVLMSQNRIPVFLQATGQTAYGTLRLANLETSDLAGDLTQNGTTIHAHGALANSWAGRTVSILLEGPTIPAPVTLSGSLPASSNFSAFQFVGATGPQQQIARVNATGVYQLLWRPTGGTGALIRSFFIVQPKAAAIYGVGGQGGAAFSITSPLPALPN